MSMMRILASGIYREAPTVKGDAWGGAHGGGAEPLRAVDVVNKMFLSQSQGDA